MGGRRHSLAYLGNTAARREKNANYQANLRPISDTSLLNSDDPAPNGRKTTPRYIPVYSLMLLAAVAFAFSLLLTPLVRNTARRLNLVDHPGERKLHHEPVPRLGGVVIAIAYVGAFAVLLLSGLQAGHIVAGSLPLFWRLAPAALVMFATGLCDDIVGLKPWQKLVGQIARQSY